MQTGQFHYPNPSCLTCPSVAMWVNTGLHSHCHYCTRLFWHNTLCGIGKSLVLAGTAWLLWTHRNQSESPPNCQGPVLQGGTAMLRVLSSGPCCWTIQLGIPTYWDDKTQLVARAKQKDDRGGEPHREHFRQCPFPFVLWKSNHLKLNTNKHNTTTNPEPNNLTNPFGWVLWAHTNEHADVSAHHPGAHSTEDPAE